MVAVFDKANRFELHKAEWLSTIGQKHVSIRVLEVLATFHAGIEGMQRYFNQASLGNQLTIDEFFHLNFDFFL